MLYFNKKKKLKDKISCSLLESCFQRLYNNTRGSVHGFRALQGAPQPGLSPLAVQEPSDWREQPKPAVGHP